jgi:hypothetical protein
VERAASEFCTYLLLLANTTRLSTEVRPLRSVRKTSAKISSHVGHFVLDRSHFLVNSMDRVFNHHAGVLLHHREAALLNNERGTMDPIYLW